MDLDLPIDHSSRGLSVESVENRFPEYLDYGDIRLKEGQGRLEWSWR